MQKLDLGKSQWSQGPLLARKKVDLLFLLRARGWELGARVKG